MSSNATGRRRSTRIKRNGTIINGNGSFPNNNNSIRSLSSQRNGNRYSGKKRRQPHSSNDDESSDNNNENNNNNHNSNNNHNNNNKRRRLNELTEISQLNDLCTQTQPTQTRNRRKLSYTVQPDKWNKKVHANRSQSRMQLRELAENTTENRATIVDPMTNAFIPKLIEQNKIFKKVSHPNEAYLDIEQTNTMSTYLKEQTCGLANEHFTITPSDYIESLCREFPLHSHENNNNNDSDNDIDDDDDEPKQIDWVAAGQRFAPWFLTVPCIQFMNGPLQQSTNKTEEKKKRQVRQKRSFTSDAPVVQPKKVVKQKQADKTETKSRVSHLRKILKKKCKSQDGVNPFEFLINPDSYSQTIENFFDLSFITKNGNVQMNVSQQTQQPVLTFVSDAERTRRHALAKLSQKVKNKRIRNTQQNQHKTNGQCIVKFNPSHFYNLIHTYDITESQIERADKIPIGQHMQQEDSDDDVDEQSESSAQESDEQSETDNENENENNNNNNSSGYKRNVRGKRYNNDKEEAD